MAKTRVYELAKELGVDSKTVLSMAKDMGEFVKSPSSTLEAPVIRRLKEKLRARRRRPDAQVGTCRPQRCAVGRYLGEHHDQRPTPDGAVRPVGPCGGDADDRPAAHPVAVHPHPG